MKQFSSAPNATLELELEFDDDSVILLDRERVIVEKTQSAQVSAEERPSQANWGQFGRIFGSTFITILLAELGDKTQIATLLMTAESHAPWTIFAGAATALITTSLLGVLIGRWLSTRLSPRTLDRAAGITLAILAIGLLLDVFQG